MTPEEARILARHKHEWPIWLFLVILYYLPAVYMAFTGGPLFMVVWGLLAGLGGGYFLELPFRAEKMLKEDSCFSGPSSK